MKNPQSMSDDEIAAALLRVGIDARLYRDDQQRVVLLRAERIAPEESLAARAADLEIGQMRQITTTDQVTGQRMHTFVGKSSFIAEMKREPRRVIGIGLPRGN